MSKEIKITAGIKYTPSLAGLKGIDSGIREIFEAAGNDYIHGTQEATASETAITANSSIANPGYIMIINTDDETDVLAGFADVSAGDDARPITVKPNSIALFYATGDIYVATASGTARIEYFIFEAAS